MSPKPNKNDRKNPPTPKPKPQPPPDAPSTVAAVVAEATPTPAPEPARLPIDSAPLTSGGSPPTQRPPSTRAEIIGVAVAILTLLGALIAVYVQVSNTMSSLSTKVDNLSERTKKLEDQNAEMSTKLTASVSRLDEVSKKLDVLEGRYNNRFGTETDPINEAELGPIQTDTDIKRQLAYLQASDAQQKEASNDVNKKVTDLTAQHREIAERQRQMEVSLTAMQKSVSTLGNSVATQQQR